MKPAVGTVLLSSMVCPGYASKNIIGREPALASLVAFLAAAFSFALSQLLVCRTALGMMSSPVLILSTFVVNVMFGLMVLTGGLCLLSFYTLLLGGKITPAGYVWSLCLSFSPWIFSAIIGIAAVLIGGLTGIAVTFPAYMILFFWGISILVSMISQVSGMDLLSSALAVVMSFASAVILFWAGSITFFMGGLNLVISLLPPA